MHRRFQQVVQPIRVDGNPSGNRQERRMAKKLQRKRNDGSDPQEDTGIVRKVK